MAISFIGGMIFFPSLDISVNMISMFGFLIVLGIVVDDAVVVGEIYTNTGRRATTIWMQPLQVQKMYPGR
ncbi:efflux RND transporter permease subunit [Mangrovivirga cuniculi]|uniref:efflux RND transporter permease subunit n=1 Tax=Mangrovivirga cuniculi TaxID=2715131 RepID=UPI0021D3B30F|nr:efflux RND transporter permease subunit [Mangrovivirga cuniculi]